VVDLASGEAAGRGGGVVAAGAPRADVGGAPRRGGVSRHGWRRLGQTKAEATGDPRAWRWRERYRPPDLPTFTVFRSAAEKRVKGLQ
jgi:hypothetical protein